jgi:hypothetical protein
VLALFVYFRELLDPLEFPYDFFPEEDLDLANLFSLSIEVLLLKIE